MITLKWLSSLPILMQESFWWRRCSVAVYSFPLTPRSKLTHSSGALSDMSTLTPLFGVKRIYPNRGIKQQQHCDFHSCTTRYRSPTTVTKTTTTAAYDSSKRPDIGAPTQHSNSSDRLLMTQPFHIHSPSG